MHYLMDLDNTLLDSYLIDENGQIHFSWAKDFEKDFAKPPQILQELFQGPFLIALQRTKMVSRFIEPFLKKHQIEISASEFIEYWLSHDIQVKEPVWNWIKSQKQKGHSFHIASNQSHIRMDYILTHQPEWQDVFDWVFTSARLGVAKPQEEFFIYAKNHLKVPFNQICLIDDSSENINVAKSLGMNGILFRSVDDLIEADKKST